ncbi:WHG domain-containing protein [Paenibacillus sp. N4]|uniref:TetR-like C-terminal domain-containing protein n=1 Tax=Paenibacillus vietnamensis TaxID=2590547 RepID=UPI001CD14D95|nr:TetR-like C-terminal domain-containing protein [Paenibacillus vietnamensis]MCA0755632.1 WHG domain-containing protein [Paenibacillus vietnamensis]
MSPRKGLDLPAIVEAAAEIADASGFEEVTLASLAQKLGVRSPSLYNHVNGLPELRVRLAVHGLKKLNEAISAALDGKTGDEAMHAVAAAYLSFARSHPGLYALTLRAPCAEHTEYAEAASALVDLLVRTLRYYNLDEEQAIHVVRGLRSYLHGFAHIESQGGFGLPHAVDESMEIVMQIYLNGLRQYKA